MKKLLCISLTLILFSCNSAQKPIEISLKKISQGNLYGNGQEQIDEQQMVITSQEDWINLKKKIISTGNSSNDLPNLSIDFKERILIVLFDKQQTTGGHSIEIVESEQTPDKIIFKYRKSHPEGMATSVMTQPYYLASIIKTNREIIFEEIK
ncbi:protease stability complex PrcB-like protein [Mesonia algae]|uniref:Protease stability complex PrcB-like protein n=1 Tax=Mesonia algae TaxID=213248 RepID=A0A2W7IYY5_9FLAO|nr:protease complex subunit PrcB family protein [Mesonia algae]PZW43883.1 protease stability complex PrcB-like protein [Mesonia algae]